MLWLRSVRERLRLSLWFVPSVLAVAAALLALVLGALDRRLASNGSELLFTFGGSPEGARSVLSTIAQSMLTFTGLVFTITMLVLQLASSQLSPRVMRTFLRDRGNQIVLGIFIATFVFTLVVLREVRTPVDGSDAFVPAVSVWVAFALLLGSVAAFVWYIDHMAHAIRASTVIANIWRETVEAIENLYPEREGSGGVEVVWTPLSRPTIVLTATAPGVIVGVDEAVLLRGSADGDPVIELCWRAGDFVPEGAPIARLWGNATADDADRVRKAIGTGPERTLDQDPAFGFRQLVDIALRALSPGTNDPTTAVQALDRLHDLLRRLLLRDIPPPTRVVDGRVRLVVPGPSWEDYVHLSLEEIRLAGADQIQVTRRLRALLDDLDDDAPDNRRGVLYQEGRELDLVPEPGVPAASGSPAGTSKSRLPASQRR